MTQHQFKIGERVALVETLNNRFIEFLTITSETKKHWEAADDRPFPRYRQFSKITGVELNNYRSDEKIVPTTQDHLDQYQRRSEDNIRHMLIEKIKRNNIALRAANAASKAETLDEVKSIHEHIMMLYKDPTP